VEVGESAELPRIIGDKRPGSKVNLEIWRDGKRREAVAVLDDLNVDANESENNAPSGRDRDDAKNKLGDLGVRVRVLTAREASRLGVAGGLVVEAVSGPAARAGLRPGDVILALNNQPVGSPAQFRQQLSQAGKRFALLVQRGEARIFVPMKLD
jgi:serine protease Do